MIITKCGREYFSVIYFSILYVIISATYIQIVVSQRINHLSITVLFFVIDNERIYKYIISLF